MRDDGAIYDFQAKKRAETGASLRAVAAVYLLYLAYTIVRDSLNGKSTLPTWLSWLTALLFTAVALAFGLYAWKTYRRELEAARLPEEDEETEIETDTDRPKDTTSEEETP